MAARPRAGPSGEPEVAHWNISKGENGQAWCLSEAPDAVAEVQAHQAVRFVQNPEDVVEVTTFVQGLPPF